MPHSVSSVGALHSLFSPGRRGATAVGAVEDVRFWSNYGRFYPELEQTTPYQQLLATIAALIDVDDGALWLDAGCGPGTTIRMIVERGPAVQIVGVDHCPVMLGHAKQKLTRQPYADRVRLVEHDLARRLDCQDNTFDGVISNLVLPYIRHHEDDARAPLDALLRETHRVLKPRGQLVWTTPVKQVRFGKVFFASWREVLDPRRPRNLYYALAILRYALAIQQRGRRGEYTFWSEAEAVEAMQRTGFGSVRTRRSFAGQALVVAGRKAG